MRQAANLMAGLSGWRWPIALAGALIIGSLTAGPSVAVEGLDFTCPTTPTPHSGYGRIVRDGNACVLLSRIIVKVADGYTVEQAETQLEALNTGIAGVSWAVTNKGEAIRFLAAKCTPDQLSLAQLDGQRTLIAGQAWAESVDRDTLAFAANSPATGAPTISGSARVGQTLTANTAGIADADGLTSVSYRYQWLAADSAVEGATGSTYTVRAADVGKTLTLRVSFTDDGGSDEVLTSAGLGPVASAGSGGGGGSGPGPAPSGNPGGGGGPGSGGEGGGGGEPPAEPTGYLEIPGQDSSQSGIGVIAGWVCEAETVKIVIDDTEYHAAYGTERTDTAGDCGDTDNGFGLLFNWNRIGDGTHTVVALADEVELGRATVTVTTLGQEFAGGLPAASCVVEGWPSTGETVTVEWQETSQNFVITNVE